MKYEVGKMVMQGLKETEYWFLIPVHVLGSYTRKPIYNGAFFPREKFRWTGMRLFLHSRQTDACLARYSLTFVPQYREVKKKKSLIGDPQVSPGHRENIPCRKLERGAKGICSSTVFICLLPMTGEALTIWTSRVLSKMEYALEGFLNDHPSPLILTPRRSEIEGYARKITIAFN